MSVNTFIKDIRIDEDGVARWVHNNRVPNIEYLNELELEGISFNRALSIYYRKEESKQFLYSLFNIK